MVRHDGTVGTVESFHEDIQTRRFADDGELIQVRARGF